MTRYLERANALLTEVRAKSQDPTKYLFESDLAWLLFGNGVTEEQLTSLEQALSTAEPWAATQVAVSGGFDPLHTGHLSMIQEAAALGEVTVILNTDAWLLRKKGYIFQPQEERKRLMEALKDVKEVIIADDSDNTVAPTLELLKPDIFVNGGDRKEDNTPEGDVCVRNGIQMVFNVGGGKTFSSSVIAKAGKVHRKWGSYQVLAEGDGYKVKLLEINGDSPGSLQIHKHRDEVWIDLDHEFRNDTVTVHRRGAEHTLLPRGNGTRLVLEVQLGIDPTEDDIERLT